MEFFIIKNDEQQGPFTLEQLSGMSIMPDTPVWHEGLDDWTAASYVEELKTLVAYAPQVGTTEPPVMPSQGKPQPPKWNHANQAYNESTQQNQWTQPTQETQWTQQTQQDPPYPVEPPSEPKPRKSHTALWVTLFIIGVLAIILAVTNPDKKAHCRAISSVTKDWTNEKIEDLGGTGIIGAIIKIGSTQALNFSVDKLIDVDNYVLCSVGYIDTGGDKSRVSFGIMGHVFTFDKNQIDEKIKEAIGIDDFSIFADDADQDNAVAPPALSQKDNDENATDEELSEDDVTAEDRAEGIFDTPAEVDTLIKAAAKEGAKMAGKALEKAVDEIFK